MVLNNLLISKKIIETLIISLPITLLFSNVLAELVILLLVIIYFSKEKFLNILKTLKNPIITALLFFWIYLILNSFFNIQNKPNFERAIFFLRFPMFVIAINYFFNNVKVDQDKIFKYWMIIFFIICLDLMYQSITHQNIFGFKAVLQGNVYRLGGFMDDELKISNLIYHFGTLIFAYNLFKKKPLSKINNLTNYSFFFLLITSIYLTAERANFITILIFTVLFLNFLCFNNFRSFIKILSALSLIFLLLISMNKDLNKRMIGSTINAVQKINILKNNSNKNFLNKDSHYFAHYSAAYQIFQRNVFLGVGLKNFRNFCDDDTLNEKIYPSWQDRKCATHPHNFHFEILSELGIIGFIFLNFFFIYVFYKFWDLSFKSKNNYLLVSSFILIANFIPFLPKGSFFSNWNAMIFWLVFSIIYSQFSKLQKQ